ncbi:MAG: hypothetical protein ABII89_01240 [Candidatus Omnitrophota bacterium]
MKQSYTRLPRQPKSDSQDTFGNEYGCSQTRWQCRRDQHRFVEKQINHYGNREEEGIYLVPTYLSIDPVYGFTPQEVNANARSNFKVMRITANGVHPGVEGYLQMADTIYGWLKGIF